MLTLLKEASTGFGMGVLIVSHDSEALQEICDTIWRLEAGRLARLEDASRIESTA
jgi:ABC-type glutathione transport system ATPase component